MTVASLLLPFFAMFAFAILPCNWHVVSIIREQQWLGGARTTSAGVIGTGSVTMPGLFTTNNKIHNKQIVIQNEATS